MHELNGALGAVLVDRFHKLAQPRYLAVVVDAEHPPEHVAIGANIGRFHVDQTKAARGFGGIVGQHSGCDMPVLCCVVHDHGTGDETVLHRQGADRDGTERVDLEFLMNVPPLISLSFWCGTIAEIHAQLTSHRD